MSRRLSQELQEASSTRVYFYLQTKDGKKTLGGPYKDLDALGRGARRAEDRGIDKETMAARKLVNGRFQDLSVDETEAMLASYDG